MLLQKDWYDTSNYDASSPLFSRTNEKVIGKFKDECREKSPIRLVGLRSKKYSSLEGKEKPFKRTAKCVKRVFVQKRVRLSAYDDERYVLEDCISTLAYGHYKFVVCICRIFVLKFYRCICISGTLLYC